MSLRGAVAPLDERMVFVFGSPRSGTTFLASAIGSCAGFVDLGEVNALKAAIPELYRLEPGLAAPRIRRLLSRTRRLAMVGGLRAVEQTPETAFVAAAAALAFPDARPVHIVRDGRDVVCSLLERGWLSAGRTGSDDAQRAFGAYPRFWVERGREDEFVRASDARRAAWAWRRYIEAARTAGERLVEVRYEQLAADPARVATHLAYGLDVRPDDLAQLLLPAHATSVNRWGRELTPLQLGEVYEEAGGLLRELGYLQ
jgi:Sulfotransferase family